jgi:hypothetical protein
MKKVLELNIEDTKRVAGGVGTSNNGQTKPTKPAPPRTVYQNNMPPPKAS